MFSLYPAKDTPHIGVSFCVVHSLLTGQCEGLKQENGCESDTHAFFVCSTPHGVSAAQARRTAIKPLGQLIKEELAAQERSVSWFARKLNIDRSNVYRLFQKNSIDTLLLARICRVLGKNFFEILSGEFDRVQNSQQ